MIRGSGFSPTPSVNNRHGVVGGRVRVGDNPDRRAEAPVWQKRFWELAVTLPKSIYDVASTNGNNSVVIQ